VQRVHFTIIKSRFEGDVRFPKVELDDFVIDSIEEFDTVTETNPIAHRYVVLTRRSEGTQTGPITRDGQRTTWDQILLDGNH
jgi:hypothetical protein